MTAEPVKKNLLGLQEHTLLMEREVTTSRIKRMYSRDTLSGVILPAITKILYFSGLLSDV